MRNFFLRSGIVFLLFFLEINFLKLFFFQSYAVNLSILLLIAWVVVAGFEKVWWAIFLLGFLSDLILGQKIGPFIIFFILLAYSVSFISKRFIIEKRFSGFLAIIIFILIGLWSGEIFDSFLDNGLNFSYIWTDLKNNYLVSAKIFWSSVLGIACFYPIYKSVDKMEKHIARFENRLQITL